MTNLLQSLVKWFEPYTMEEYVEIKGKLYKKSELKNIKKFLSSYKYKHGVRF